MYGNTSTDDLVGVLTGAYCFGLIIGIAIQIAIIVAAVKMAEKRGRSGGLWGFMAFLLGIAALIILALIGDSPEMIRYRENRARTRENPPQSGVGQARSLTRPKAPVVMERKSPVIKSSLYGIACPYCGADIQGYPCPFCGGAAPEEPAEKE